MKKLALAWLSMAGLLTGCLHLKDSGRPLMVSPSVPSAEGTVTFRKLDSDDTGIDLRVRRLAEPAQLNPPGYTYVAWLQPTREDPPQNIGALSLDRELAGELRTVTPLRRFEIFVTAEAASDAAQPTGERLLWTEKN